MKKTLHFFTILLLTTLWLPNTAYSQGLSENFDSGTFPPMLWSIAAGTGNWDNSSEVADHTTATASFARYDCYNTNGTAEAMLISPTLVVTSADKTFSFWANYYVIDAQYTSLATLYIDVSSNNGTSWTSGTTNYIASQAGSGWLQTSLDLSNFESQNFVGDNVIIRFRASSDWGGYNIGIDDVAGPVIDANFNEIEVTNILGDFGGFNASSSDSVKVLVTNNGLTDQTNIPMKYTLDGGTVVSGIMTSLLSFDTDTFTFATTIDVSSDGLHILKVYSDLTNDEDRTNDTLVKNIVTPINTPVPTLISFPNNYDTHVELVDYSGSNTDIINLAASTAPEDYGIHMTSTINSYYVFAQADIEDAFTNTTQITETNLKVDATLNTHVFVNFDLATTTAYANCTWVRVLINDSIYAKTLDGDSVWTDNSFGWKNITLNLDAFTGSIFKISFQGALKYGVAKAAPGNNVYIDNINFFVPPADDVEVSEFLGNYGGFDITNHDTVRVVVKNNGTSLQTSVPIKYQITNGTLVSETITSIAALSTDTFTFATTYDATATNHFSLTVYSALTNDQNTNNDTIRRDINSYSTQTFPLTEGFENGLVYFENASTNNSQFVNETSIVHSGSQSVHNAYTSSNTNILHETGVIDLSTSTNPVFDFWHIAETEEAYDYSYVEISLDSGQTYTALADSLYLGESAQYVGNESFDQDAYTNWNGTIDNTKWIMERFNLAPYKTTPIRIRFKQTSDSGVEYDGWYIDDISVKEEPAAMANLGNDTIICGGSNFTLDAGSGVGYNYLWTTGTDTLSQTTRLITVNTIGTFEVQVIGINSIAYDTIVISGYPLITFNTLTSTCPNSSSFALSGATPINGTYSGIGVDTNGFFDPIIAGIGNHDITYTYTDTSGCTNTAQQVQVVNVLPIIAITAANNPVSYNTSTTLTASVSNAIGTLSYSWTPTALINGSSIMQTATTNNITSVNTYTVDIYDATTTCSNSDSITISYTGGPISINPIVTPTTICSGDTAFLNAQSAGGNGTLQFAWVSVPSGYISTLENPIDMPLVDTWYFLTVFDGVNTVTDSVFVTVLPLPSASYSVPSSVICDGNSVDNIVNFTGTAPFDYIYNGIMISGVANIADTIIVTPNTTTTYVITSVIDNSGCIALGNIDSTVITVNPTPNIDLGADQNVCINHTIILDAGAGFTSYLWSTGATTQTISLDSLTFSIGNNDYSVDVINSDNCNNSDAVTLIVDPCTGILTPQIESSNINVIPNPNNGQFQIDISGLENKSYDLSIYNTIGSKVFSKLIESTGQSTQSLKIDLSTYAKGIYFVRLQSEGQIKVKKIIIQ